MQLIQVFEPAMCCSTGVCSTEVDPLLVQFAADLDAVRREGAKVERFNLSQNPSHFATTPAILSLLQEKGADVLPAILVNGTLVHHGSYPDRASLETLVRLHGGEPEPPSTVERARAALADSRSVFLCVADATHAAFLQPFRRAAENAAFGASVELIEFAGRTDDEQALMAEVGLPAGEPAAVLIVPPGYVSARWVGSADEGDVLVRLLQASSRCTPGGGCCS